MDNIVSMMWQNNFEMAIFPRPLFLVWSGHVTSSMHARGVQDKCGSLHVGIHSDDPSIGAVCGLRRLQRQLRRLLLLLRHALQPEGK